MLYRVCILDMHSSFYVLISASFHKVTRIPIYYALDYEFVRNTQPFLVELATDVKCCK